jgi:U5 small nuclear ribonucleoprotein component
VAVEPLNLFELPKMVAGMRRITKSYPVSSMRVEESGEHVLMGVNELAFDCMMNDLRNLYSGIEVKVSDPFACFCETVLETSSLKAQATSSNNLNTLGMVSEPLDAGMADDITSRRLIPDALTMEQKDEVFMNEYHWDLLSVRSIWAWDSGSSSSSSSGNVHGTEGTNVLLNDTLPTDVDTTLLSRAKESIIQGFQWACKEGPLCDEPMRSVKVKLMDVTLSSDAIQRGGGQLIPAARRCVYSSFLLANPRLMEPIMKCSIQCSPDLVNSLYQVISRRRGHIVEDFPKPGAPYYMVNAFLPLIDSFGFETDLRCYSQGQAMVYSYFDHWKLVEGDPLDSSYILQPLEPTPPQFLSRDFMIKTRRRKGLSDETTITKYFDQNMLKELARQQMG